jgi:hypothetical protein
MSYSNKSYLISKYDQLPQTSELTFATYVWLDSTGELVRNKTRTLDFAPLAPTDLPWWDTTDALSTSYINTDIFLKPVRLFSDPFFKFECPGNGSSPHRNVLVLCETYKYNKTHTGECNYVKHFN